jgi:hypothetical protein
MYTPKTSKDYEKFAEWLLIKLEGKLEVDKLALRMLATAFADTANNAYDSALIDLGKFRNRTSLV